MKDAELVKPVELIKPIVIQAFEKRFKIKADHWGDVFYIRVASSWEDLFMTAFCFLNDPSINNKNAFQFKSGTISSLGVMFEGRLLFRNIWGSLCMLGQGRMTTPHSLGRLPINLIDGVYLLAPVGSNFSWD